MYTLVGKSTQYFIYKDFTFQFHIGGGRDEVFAFHSSPISSNS